MNTLGTRLFAAFFAVILVVVGVVSLALLVLLRNTPLVERQAFITLNTASAGLLREWQALEPNLSRRELQRLAHEAAEAHGLRLLLATPGGEVLLDSHAGDLPAMDFQAFRAARRDSAFPGATVGRARDERLGQWLYLAQPLGPNRLLVVATPTRRFSALAFFLENLFRPLAQAAALATLAAGVLAVLISRSIALPLRHMAEVAHNIAQGRNEARAPETGPDEVRALGQSLNRMARQVQANQQSQRDFLANVSHELKTPLTSIQGFAQAIMDGAVTTTEGAQRAASIIYTEADRLRRLVDGLLDLARLDAGLKSLRRARVDLAALLAALVEQFGLRAREQNVTLRLDAAPNLPAISGDGDRLAQVFTNLLDNALRHTPAGGQVTVTAAPAPGAVEVAVTDTGPGIPPDDLNRIFERFYQVDKSRAQRGGVGLGLTISRDIVEAHGGSLHAENAPGGGARFVVRLPAG